jgi:hypothetical protein
MSDEFTLMENRLRQPFLAMVKKYGKQKYTLWMVWTYMLWRSTNGAFCLPEELVMEDLGIDVHILRKARAVLAKEGWLRKDILRDTGGAYLTRGWVLTSPPMEKHSVDDNDAKSFVSPPSVFTTEVKSPYSVSYSGSGSGSASRSGSASHACSSSGSDSGTPVPSMCTSKDGGKAKLEPEPEPTATPTPTPVVPTVMVKPPKVCKECGEELKRDENHLLVCQKLNPRPKWVEDAFGEEPLGSRRLDNWEEL